MKRQFVNTKCPLCGKEVERIALATLREKPHHHNAELVITKTGLKQYIHSSCWYKMIEEKRPYTGKMYV